MGFTGRASPSRASAVRGLRQLCVHLSVGLLLAGLPAAAFEPLPRAAPESLAIDPVRLDQAFTALEAAPGRRAVVVVREGFVVGERYWVGSDTSLHHLRSVTKSFTSTLVGLALDRELIESIDSRMVDYLPWHLQPSDPAKDAITLRHLLTMSSGIQWSENDEIVAWLAEPDPVRFILARPLESPPGSDFTYNTAASHLLSVVLTEATDAAHREFADTHLFGPLGITDWQWDSDPQGYPYGGHGLQLRTEDMAKFGVLFLDRGRWHGEQMISSRWVVDASDKQFELGVGYGPLSDIHYGFLWWLDRGLEHRVFIAWGWGGQFVFCVPALELVVATSSDWWVPLDQANVQETAILHAIVDELLPAVSDQDPFRPSGRDKTRQQRPFDIRPRPDWTP
jgi:CubicO group peptidase (beta-lactamase class C family)